MSRTFVCRCEDVTHADLEGAWHKGHRSLEEVKRYTGFGTGPCGGKECLGLVGQWLRQRAAGAVHPFTSRPPIASVPLAALAGIGELATIPPMEETREPPTSGQPAGEPLPTKAEVVIIGGGIVGRAIAYELACRGTTDVVVLEKSYVNYGASGRNGGGLRVQWSTETKIRLMQESMEVCRAFASTMGVNVWLRQGGYLFLARTEEAKATLERSASLQNRLGVATEILTPQEIRKVVPEIDTEGILAAAHHPNDAVIFPWPFLWGYTNAAAQQGVSFHNFTPVTGIRRDGHGVCAVETSRGVITTRTVLLATGAWTPTLGRFAGVTIPSWPHRHEICSTEPLKPWLQPLVAELGTGLYFSQSMRGEIVAGISLPDEEGLPNVERRVNLAARLIFLRQLAKRLLRIVPRLGHVRVLRQWAGPYDYTPDGHPLLGPHPGCPGLWLCSGFVGHGFMMAPAVARHVAAAMTGRQRHSIFDEWRVDRFDRGETRAPEQLTIG